LAGLEERKQENEAVIAQLLKWNPFMDKALILVVLVALLMLSVVIGGVLGYPFQDILLVYLIIKTTKTDLNLIKEGIG